MMPYQPGLVTIHSDVPWDGEANIDKPVAGHLIRKN